MMTSKMSFRQLTCLVFVIFSLYLLGDAFYRWDGFRYHSTFMEFIPAVALVSILWSIVAMLASILVWLLLKSIEWVCHRTGLKITIEHLLVYLSVVMLSGVLVWQGKRLLFADVHTTYQIKLAALISVALISLLVTWLVRNRTGNWITATHDRITPLVWLFAIFVLISVPVVAYHTWFKDTGNVISQKATPSQVTDKKRPNIILVTFDALSAKDMSAYGYGRPTTPFINEWAKEATLFTSLEASSNWTTPTTASLMTGKRVWSHMASHIQGALPVKSDTESLPLILKKNGYYNIAIVANPVASVQTLGVAGSFDVAPPSIEFSTPHSLLGGGVEAVGIIDKLLYRLFADKIKYHDWIVKEDFILGKFLSKLSRDISITTTPPEKAFNKMLEVLNNDPPEPYFAWIHVLPPHAPYLPSEPYMGMFDHSSEMKTYKSQWKMFEQRAEYVQYDYFPPEVKPSIDILRSRYDEFIVYCDEKFKEFIEKLTAREKLDNAVIILSADHGESFNHAYLSHGGSHLYEQVTNIPLIIKEPMQNDKRIIHQLVEQIDITATISDLAGIPIPSWMEGRSLVPLIRGEQLTSKPAFSMNLEKNPRHGKQITRGVIAVWEGDYKLIQDLDEKKSLLFNLKEDPDESKNLFNKETETSHRLLDLINKYLEDANQRIKGGI